MAFKCPPLKSLEMLGGPDMGALVAQYQHSQRNKFSESSANGVSTNWRVWGSFCERTSTPVLPLTAESRDRFLLDNALRGVSQASVDNYRRTLGLIHKMAGEAFPWPAQEANRLWEAAQRRSAQEHVLPATPPTSDATESVDNSVAPSSPEQPLAAATVPEGASESEQNRAKLESPTSVSAAPASPPLALDMAQVDWSIVRRHLNTSLDSLVRILETGPNDTQRISTICRVVETLASVRDTADGVKVLRASLSSVRKLEKAEGNPLTFDVAEVQRRLRSVTYIIDRIVAAELLRADGEYAALRSMRGHLDWCSLKLEEAQPGNRGSPGAVLGVAHPQIESKEDVDRELRSLNERVQQLEADWERAREFFAHFTTAVRQTPTENAAS